jgi:hypothetical protein
MSSIPGGRKLACLYHASEWWLLRGHHWAYHVVSIAFLFAIVVLVYTIARRVGLARVWSLVIGAAIIVFPGADSTRLWPVASIGQYVIVLQMTSLLVAILALDRRWGWRSGALHLLSALFAVLAMATYEIAVPLVAVQGVVYVAIFRDRRAVVRWMLDIGLVLVFIVYRLTLAPVDNSAFMVERTTSQLVARAGALLEGAWNTWRYLYAPGAVLSYLIVVVLVAAVATALSQPLRDRLSRWWLLLVAAVVAAAACAGVFLTAEDLYLPVYASTYNRVNLPGTIPYVLAFIAIIGLAYELIRYWSRRTWAASLTVLLVMTVVGVHQITVNSRHQDDWLSSWSIQEKTLPRMRAALQGVPSTARVLGFDSPQWTHEWIPVVAQSWGLRGMLDYETHVNPSFASPFSEGVHCDRRGIEAEGTLAAPYRDQAHPVYFMSPARGLSVHVASQRRCEHIVHAWGRAPLFAN